MNKMQKPHVTRFEQTLSRQRGFSAIEVTMVATVIAILALIALPVFLERVKDAREKATLDEMAQISKAQQLAYADTGHYFRLQDLDNTSRYTDITGIEGVTYEDSKQDPRQFEFSKNRHIYIPNIYWNSNNELSLSQRRILARQWKGPYVKYQQKDGEGSIFWRDIRINVDFFNLLTTTSGDGGPIPHFSDPAPPPGPTEDQYDNDEDLYPVDAWGTPYIFFATDLPSNDSDQANETFYHSAYIFSCGPDGLPGDGQPFESEQLMPWWVQHDAFNGQLGLGDDLSYRVR